MTNQIIRTFRYRLKPTKKQSQALQGSLDVCREAHNAALQERRDAWKLCRKSVSFFEQSAQIREIRALRPDVESVPFVFVRESLRRLDKSFKAFFGRIKRGEKPGFPRFKSADRYNSITVYQDDFSVEGERVKLLKIGCVRMKLHRPLRGRPKQCTVKRLGKKWQVSIACELGQAPAKLPVRTAIGIDVGLSTFVTLSNGAEIENPRWVRQSESLIARLNRSLARKPRRSRNRDKVKESLRRAHEQVHNRRLNFCHHISKALVSKYDLIAFEALNVREMLRGRFSKSILDAAWSQLLWQIAYKAESAGRYAIAVDPRGTTQRCAGCGETVPKTLSERVHSCPHCGLISGRDHNAAINILQAGRACAGLLPQESSN